MMLLLGLLELFAKHTDDVNLDWDKSHTKVRVGDDSGNGSISGSRKLILVVRFTRLAKASVAVKVFVKS